MIYEFNSCYKLLLGLLNIIIIIYHTSTSTNLSA